MNYRYGDSWERYPIREGEVWQDAASGSLVSICDITKEFPSYLLEADMIYCDPPWNLGNANAFYTKAGRTDYLNRFHDFSTAFFSRVMAIAAPVCYVEIGRQHRGDFVRSLEALYPCVQEWRITYYRKHPCFLLRGGAQMQAFDFAGMDDVDTPGAAIAREPSRIVADLCTGQGLTAVAAFRLARRFVGTELNPRRLAVTIDRVNKLGGSYARTVSQGYGNRADT